MHHELDTLNGDLSRAEETRASQAFRGFLYGGNVALTPEAQALLSQHGAEFRDGLTGALAFPSAAGGGYLVPPQFIAEAWAMLKQTDRLFDTEAVTTKAETPKGGPLGVPAYDDTGNPATLVTEAALQTNYNVPNLGSVTFGSLPMWRSGIVLASRQMEQDSGVPLDSILARSFAVRFARGCGAALVSKLLAAAQPGAIAEGSAPVWGNPVGSGISLVGYADLLALLQSVDPLYLAAPKAHWLMAFSTLLMIWSLIDSVGHPLIPPAYNGAGEPLLLGLPVALCPSFPAIAAGTSPIAVGDTGRFLVRTLPRGMWVNRYDERWAEFGKIGFEGYLRIDGGLQYVSTSPVSDCPVKTLVIPSP